MRLGSRHRGGCWASSQVDVVRARIVEDRLELRRIAGDDAGDVPVAVRVQGRVGSRERRADLDASDRALVSLVDVEAADLTAPGNE